jgi:hypothetical protein
MQPSWKISDLLRHSAVGVTDGDERHIDAVTKKAS